MTPEEEFDESAPETIEAGEPAEAAKDDRSDELDGVRIRQLAALRRAAARARSYALIGAVVSFVASAKLAVMTVAHVQKWGWGSWPIGYALFAVAALMIGVHFAKRVRELHREVQTPASLPPTPPGGPDFSTLSDGSQQWKNLEDIR